MLKDALYIREGIDRIRKGILNSTELNLSGHNRSPESDLKKHMDELAPLLPSSGVTHLNLGIGNFEVSTIASLLDVLPQTGITILNLESNSMGDKGAAILGQKILGTNVRSLNLRWHYITDKGAEKLVPLVASGQLTELVLTNNNITAAGAKALIDALPEDKPLDLKLNYNKGADAAFGAILSKFAGHKLLFFSGEELELGAKGKPRLAVIVLPNHQTIRISFGDFELWPSHAAHVESEIAQVISSMPAPQVAPATPVVDPPEQEEADETPSPLTPVSTAFKENIAAFTPEIWLTPDSKGVTPLHKIIASGEAVYKEFFHPSSWIGSEAKARGLVQELKKPENRSILADLYKDAWQLRALIGQLDKATRQNAVG